MAGTPQPGLDHARGAPILVAGEALYDLVMDERGGVTGHPGGGPFNTARTIGRLGRPVAFLGRLSTDGLGATHARMLRDDGVDLGPTVYSDDPTTLALATLGPGGGVASYSFYTDGTAAAGLTREDALAAVPARVAALHVGTLGIVLEPVGSAIESVVERLAGTTIVVLDPNVRTHVIADEAAFRARLDRLIGHSDVVKVSEEDLAWLDPARSASAAARALLRRGPAAVLLTRGGDGAAVLTPAGDMPIAAVPAQVVDTIGAGDAFGGGFVAWWISHGLGAADLAHDELVMEAARFAAVVAARTVARAGAVPPRVPAEAAGRRLSLESLD